MLLICSEGCLKWIHIKTKLKVASGVGGDMLRAQYADLYYLVPGYTTVTPLALVVTMQCYDGTFSGWSSHLHKPTHAY